MAQNNFGMPLSPIAPVDTVVVACIILEALGQGSPTFLKLRATSCVPINVKGY